MLIDKFLEKGKAFLGCKYPIMCGAMTWVSDPKLVSTIGNAGGFGLLAGGNTPVDIFEEQIIETQELTDKPFGVNLITLAPVYESQLELVCKLGCPFVVFGQYTEKIRNRKSQTVRCQGHLFRVHGPAGA